MRQVVLSEQMMMMMADIGSQREYTILSEDLNLCFAFLKRGSTSGERALRTNYEILSSTT